MKMTETRVIRSTLEKKVGNLQLSLHKEGKRRNIFVSSVLNIAAIC